jgi:hypothetical protein
MTHGGGQILRVTSNGIAGLKVAIYGKLRRLTRNGGAGACCRVASVASLLVGYNLRRLVLGCAKPSSFGYSGQNSNTRTKKAGSVKSILRAVHSPAAHSDNPSDQ